MSRNFVQRIGQSAMALIACAAQIRVTDYQGETVPATIVAFDYATGFGLIKPMGQIATKPIKMGTATGVSLLQRLMIVTGGEDHNISLAAVVSRRSFAG